MKVFFDFETRSTVDLRKAGTHVYAQHPTTDIVCLGWAVDDGPVKVYRPLDGDEIPEELFKLIEDGAEFYAHNANFDRLIWHYVLHVRYGWPPIPIEQIFCTMVMALSMGIMASLENMAVCLGLKIEKDMRGHRVMLQLAKPRNVDEKGKITWWEREDSTPSLDINKKYDDTYSYCATDIDVMREAFKRMVPLDETERKMWLLDQCINDRGVYIDIRAGKNAIMLATIEAFNLNESMQKLTKNVVSSCNAHAALRKWVNEQGVETESVDAATVIELLAREKLPKKVRRVLDVRQSAAKSSVSKIKKMIAYQNKDGRVKGCLQYYGAASTGRWAGRGIQLQNFPRPKLKQKEIEEVLNMLGKVK